MKKTAFLLMAYAFFMLLFAILWHFLLPYSGNSANYLTMINNDYWFITNFAGFLGTCIGLFALFSFYNYIKNQLKLTGKLGFIITIIAFLIHLCLLSWETFIFSIIGTNEKATFLISEGVFLKSKYTLILYSFFSLAFFTGILLLGIGLVKTKRYLKLPIYALITGASVYSFAVAFGSYVGFISFLVYLLGITYIGAVEYRLAKV